MTASASTAFVPSVNGFHFDNNFPAGATYPVVTLPIVGTVASQDAARGLCGGFVFAALDLFESSPRTLPPAATSAPADGSPLFEYLVTRFLASLGSESAWANSRKAIDWIQAPDHDDFLPIHGAGLARRMVGDEWPAIRADIDRGSPSPLYLVMEPRADLTNVAGVIAALGHSHQVLAYAYSLDARENLSLAVYDPNDAGNNSSSIGLEIGDPSRTISVSAPAIERAIAEPTQIRGLFRAAYSWGNPATVTVQ